MSSKNPVRVVFDGSNNATGLAEYQSGEFIPLTHGGLGASLSIGSAGQVLKVNSGASALEFGAVEAILNIDGMTDGSGITVVDGDLLAISDNGTEKKIAASQLKSYIGGYDGSISTLDIDGGTDIGAALADADLFIVDDGAGGTNRKLAASRIKTYVADVTLTTAAQSNITSLGTLTTLTVDNVIVNGATIGHTSDTDLMTLADGVLTVAGEVDAVSLDVSGDADIDGTLEADAITIGGVTLAETISDTVGAMVTSNTETGVTVTYDDSDNTLDFVIGTLNQNTTGSAATLTTARTIGGTSFDGSANIAVALSTAATTLETARTIAGQSFDGSANITIASTDLSNTSAIALLTASQTMTNKTLTSPQINTQVDFLARAEARFQDASGGQYVALEAPATVSSNVTFTLPAADGSANQVLKTDGAGALSFTDVATSGFTNSTLTDTPGASANFDLAKGNNTGSAETPFESGGSDAFGVSVGFVFDAMEPIGSSTDNNLDYGSGESHVGA